MSEEGMLISLLSLKWRILDMKCVKLLSPVLVTPTALLRNDIFCKV